jgi:hypothetical protein
MKVHEIGILVRFRSKTASEKEFTKNIMAVAQAQPKSPNFGMRRKLNKMLTNPAKIALIIGIYVTEFALDREP